MNMRFGLLLTGLFTSSLLLASGSSTPQPTPKEVLDLLKAGNQRFVDGTAEHPSADPKRRAAVASGQHPFATILTCSDSRTPPELIFDCGLGEIFIIRVAGNVVDKDITASIEYGAAHLETPIMMVMGHTKCGAVTASVENAEVHGSLPHLLAHINPAEKSARAKHPGARTDEIVKVTIVENVWLSVEDLLTQSADLRKRVAAGTLRVVGALYDLETGQVSVLGDHPAQAKIMAEAGSSASTTHGH